MNANELADEFKEENNDWNEDNLRHWGKQTEAMLRQQQARIKQLEEPETPCEELRRLQNEENNKPVALTQVEIMNALTLGVPLYTHPVKELTDEEIIEIAKDCGYANRYKFNIQFARAILRKASEK